MRPPEFWSNPPERPGWQAKSLSPLAAVYAAATARRVARAPQYRAGCPVICVGNLNAGGAGKTPTVIALAERLGEGVHVVSRGYGGRESGPVQVDASRHRAADVGDEPLLIAAFAPTWVARDRAAAVGEAENAGARVILMDDGFQNPQVAKSLSILVVDAEAGFGNGRVIPAGPLREPVRAGLERADLLLSIGGDAAQRAFCDRWGSLIDLPRATAHIEVLPTGMDWNGLRVVAFAGIARPAKFFATLKELGANVVRAEALDDHQPLSDALMTRLEKEAKAEAAQLVTTEKDTVRLPSAFRGKVLALPVRLVFDQEDPLNEALARLTL